MSIISLKKYKNPIDIEVTCRICGKKYIIRVEKEDYERYIKGEAHIQVIFPYLSAGDRELLLSNTCNNCWHALFDEEF